MRISNYYIGADPELFITDGDKVISAVGLLPGSKEEPYISDDMPKGFGLQTDNILAEFNIPPVNNVVSFVNNIEYMKDYIRNYVKNINPNYDILCSASQIVDEDQLQTDQAKEFGCSVDYNVYTKSANPKPNGEQTNLRSAGMHIHVSYENNNINTSLDIIRILDVFLGIPSVILDNDSKRRELYGKAGCFRLKDYGLEYRTLSGIMLSKVKYLRFIYDQITRAFKLYNEAMLRLPDADLVIFCINNNDENLAKKLIVDFNICNLNKLISLKSCAE